MFNSFSRGTMLHCVWSIRPDFVTSYAYIIAYIVPYLPNAANFGQNLKSVFLTY